MALTCTPAHHIPGSHRAPAPCPRHRGQQALRPVCPSSLSSREYRLSFERVTSKRASLWRTQPNPGPAPPPDSWQLSTKAPLFAPDPQTPPNALGIRLSFASSTPTSQTVLQGAAEADPCYMRGCVGGPGKSPPPLALKPRTSRQAVPRTSGPGLPAPGSPSLSGSTVASCLLQSTSPHRPSRRLPASPFRNIWPLKSHLAPTISGQPLLLFPDRHLTAGSVPSAHESRKQSF